ncbi:sugar ABC transporter substrate-binding protein [Trebonia kvetii]|uniref:Sugar ABC transporter substrate-binding protein n=1 Tax=Trebonia kvetii TaxID=2480626 RepID=A0A6P2C243_9ACTN|nr:sugar ABC transporter substrate-binding protein [Trebonia kvetii]
MSSLRKRAGLTAAGVTAALLIAACSPGAGSTSAPAATSSAASSSGAGAQSLTVSDIGPSFRALKPLASLAPEGRGNVAVILPDTTSSTRWVEFDAPYLKAAFAAAGLPPANLIVQNALGSDATQVSMAQSDITQGATVLIICPLDSGTGAHIEQLAKAAGVLVIDYDRLTLGGTRGYYVSFDNVRVGTVMGGGFTACVKAWHVKDPNVIVMQGAPTDNNATLFAQGYLGVLNPLFKAGTYKDISNPPGSWDPPTSLSEFQQQSTAHKNINAALIPNDANAAAIIHYLQGQGVKPQTFPTTGQDASLAGLQNILAGYQCGTVYKPIYLEAGATAALAMYLRAGKSPPSSLVSGSVMDTIAKVSIPSVLATPEWVNTANMNDTVIKDKFVPVSQLCTGQYASACQAAGISG